MTDQALEGKLAVVAGGTGSMGTAIVESLAARGLDVIVVSRTADTAKDLAARVPRVRICTADVANDGVMDALAPMLDRPVRMVVHAVGLPPSAMGHVTDLPISEVIRGYDIKVGGMMRLVRAADAHFEPGSRIVAIGGHLAFEPEPREVNAGLANVALVNLIKQYSQVYGPREVSAHLVAPAATYTDRLERALVGVSARTGRSRDEVLDDIRSHSPIGLITTPGHIAWAVATLLAPEAAGMTGSVVMMDAGRRHGF